MSVSAGWMTGPRTPNYGLLDYFGWNKICRPTLERQNLSDLEYLPRA